MQLFEHGGPMGPGQCELGATLELEALVPVGLGSNGNDGAEADGCETAYSHELLRRQS